MGSSCSTPFQYPSSGSTDCNSTRQAYGRPLACTLFQYPSSGSTDCNWPRSAPPPGRTPTLSVSLKRIDGLQPPGAQQQRVQPPELFQYPSSGSTDCNLLGVGWHAADLAASFSIPQADRRTATHRHPRPGPPRAVRFQYPSSGSTDCNAAVRRVVRAAGHPPFSIPQADRRTATALAAAAADPCWFAFSIPQADRRTATTSRPTWPTGTRFSFSIPQADRRTATGGS